MTRSCVSGLAVVTFSIFRAIALASKTQIQIGRKNFSSASRRTTTGVFETGSRRSPLISIFFNERTLPFPSGSFRETPDQRVFEPFFDPDPDVTSRRRARRFRILEMHDSVARGSPAQCGASLVAALDEDVEHLPFEGLVVALLDRSL